MAEVVKTIENVDELFSQIVVNGETHESDRYVPRTLPASFTSSRQSAVNNPQSSLNQNQPVEPVQGEDVYAVELNSVLHDFDDRELAIELQEEATARSNADTSLRNDLDAEILARGNADESLQEAVNANTSDISDIEAKIPAQASAQNQLADKAFVNSSIATNTANFLGTYTSLADIEAIPNPTNNDYAFLEETDSSGNVKYARYKYSAEDDEWLFEYYLNNSSFTAEQWATINSGLTATSVSDAIEELDVPSAGGTGQYVESISEVDGKIIPVVKNLPSLGGSSYIISANTTITGAVLQAGDVINLYFTQDIAGTSVDHTLVLNYNTVDYDVKVMKDGSLVAFEAETITGNYNFIQAGFPVSFMFDGTDFIVVENPVVLNIDGYNITANGEVLRRKIVYTGSGSNTIKARGYTEIHVRATHDITLDFDSTEGAVVDVYNHTDATIGASITYYQTASASENIQPRLETKTTFVYTNAHGWLLISISNAIWN